LPPRKIDEPRRVGGTDGGCVLSREVPNEPRLDVEPSVDPAEGIGLDPSYPVDLADGRGQVQRLARDGSETASAPTAARRCSTSRRARSSIHTMAGRTGAPVASTPTKVSRWWVMARGGDPGVRPRGRGERGHGWRHRAIAEGLAPRSRAGGCSAERQPRLGPRVHHAQTKRWPSRRGWSNRDRRIGGRGTRVEDRWTGGRGQRCAAFTW